MTRDECRKKRFEAIAKAIAISWLKRRGYKLPDEIARNSGRLWRPHKPQKGKP